MGVSQGEWDENSEWWWCEMVDIVSCAPGTWRSDVVIEECKSIDTRPRETNEDCGRQFSKAIHPPTAASIRKDRKRRTQYSLLSAAKDRCVKAIRGKKALTWLC